MDDYLKINEIFGPTIQGEGFSAGQHCLFIRTFGCNLECSWCDTAKTWATTPEKAAKTATGKLFDEARENRDMTPRAILSILQMKWDVIKNPTLIVISGGEPMMQQRNLYSVTRKLFDWGNKIHVETAGTIKSQPDFNLTVTQYNVSPKLQHSGNDFKKRYKPDALRSLANTGKARFKFVMTSTADFHEIDFIVSDIGLYPGDVMVMPEGNTAEGNMDLARKIIDGALERGYGLSFRSHVLIWGMKEGV